MIPRLPSAAEFDGKVAVVTGGSAGLGRDLVRALVGFGSEVFFCAKTETHGRKLSKELGRRAHFIPVDLADPSAARAFALEASAFSGRIDYLVNNAAIDPRIEFERASVEDFDRLIAVNLRPHFIVAQACLPALKRGQGKAIVNLSSTNFMLGHAPFTLYNAGKSGIVGFTRSLARELGPMGIRANAVSPGWIMTAKQLREHATPGDQKALLEAQSLKFLLREGHVTPLTLFLLSRASGAITGQNMVVDGGKVMQ